MSNTIELFPNLPQLWVIRQKLFDQVSHASDLPKELEHLWRYYRNCKAAGVIFADTMVDRYSHMSTSDVIKGSIPHEQERLELDRERRTQLEAFNAALDHDTKLVLLQVAAAAWISIEPEEELLKEWPKRFHHLLGPGYQLQFGLASNPAFFIPLLNACKFLALHDAAQDEFIDTNFSERGQVAIQTFALEQLNELHYPKMDQKELNTRIYKMLNAREKRRQ